MRIKYISNESNDMVTNECFMEVNGVKEDIVI